MFKVAKILDIDYIISKSIGVIYFSPVKSVYNDALFHPLLQTNLKRYFAICNENHAQNHAQNHAKNHAHHSGLQDCTQIFRKFSRGCSCHRIHTGSCILMVTYIWTSLLQLQSLCSQVTAYNVPLVTVMHQQYHIWALISVIVLYLVYSLLNAQKSSLGMFQTAQSCASNLEACLNATSSCKMIRQTFENIQNYKLPKFNQGVSTTVLVN